MTLGVSPGLNIIYARSENHCIGADGGLPWRLPDEYAHFEDVTRGYPMIMGRKSYEDHDGLLPGGTNIIVSNNPKLAVEPEAILANNLSEAIQRAAVINASYFVIGGAGLISEAMPYASSVFETVVSAKVTGDTFLPEFDFSTWQTETLFRHEVDRAHNMAFTCFRRTRRGKVIQS